MKKNILGLFLLFGISGVQAQETISFSTSSVPLPLAPELVSLDATQPPKLQAVLMDMEFSLPLASDRIVEIIPQDPLIDVHGLKEKENVAGMPFRWNFTGLAPRWRSGAQTDNFNPPSNSPLFLGQQLENPYAAARSTDSLEDPPQMDAKAARFDVSQRCAKGVLGERDCRFHWLPALRQQLQFLTVETTWNISTDQYVRYDTFHGRFWHNYYLALQGFRFSRWNDDNAFWDDFVGHPMMGAITMDIFLQNYPRGATLELENSKEYWHTRLWALLWSTVYSAEWKLGPISEASVGNTGTRVYWEPTTHKFTNGTGTVGLVVTPLGGWVWSIGEDLIDKHILRDLETKSSNRLYLFWIQILNPSRAFANLMRFKPVWYRDNRIVGAR